jgi:hypothetical protein
MHPASQPPGRITVQVSLGIKQDSLQKARRAGSVAQAKLSKHKALSSTPSTAKKKKKKGKKKQPSWQEKHEGKVPSEV